MNKKYVIFTKEGKKKKEILDEQMFKIYSSNPEIEDLVEFPNQFLMEKAYADISGKLGQRKTLLD